MAATIEVKVPDIGDFTDVPVIEILVKPGDRVDADTPLITLESDKATMEVPAPQAGTVRALKLREGDKVSKGSVILLLDPAAAPDGPAVAETGTPPANTVDAPPPVADSKPAAGGEVVEVKVPDIGDFTDVPVIEILVKPGDRVDADTPLITLESDKATMEVPAPQAGTVRALKLKEGDKVSAGTPILLLRTSDTGGEPPAPRPQPAAGPAEPPPRPVTSDRRQAAVTAGVQAPPAGAPTPAATTSGGAVQHASPAVRKFARELGVDLARVRGSGPRGRILREDVQAFVKQGLSAQGTAPVPAAGAAALPVMPVVDFSQWGPVEVRPLARIRRLSAANLHRNWLLVPHVTQTDSADITELEAFRKAHNTSATGMKLTLLPFVMKACAATIGAYPEFGASLDAGGENLIVKRYCHVGFAADTDGGLVVPVVRDADKKGVARLAEECGELAARARDGKLKAEEMKGGCFSISSLGGIGGSHFTPIVNAPEVAILGVSRAATQPVWDGGQFVPRLMLPLSLSYDHRVIDGAYAARFITHLVGLLSDLRRLIL